MTTVTLTPEHLHRLNALTAFSAPRNSIYPILESVIVSVAGGELQGVASDRYAAALWRGECAPNEELAQVAIPAQLIADALKGMKNAYQAHLTYDPVTEKVTIDWHEGMVSGWALQGNIPPLLNLFPKPEELAPLPQGIGLNTSFLARLAKLTRPHKKPAERMVPLALSATNDGERPLLHAAGDGYQALIHPTIKRP